MTMLDDPVIRIEPLFIQKKESFQLRLTLTCTAFLPEFAPIPPWGDDMLMIVLKGVKFCGSGDVSRSLEEDVLWESSLEE